MKLVSGWVPCGYLVLQAVALLTGCADSAPFGAHTAQRQADVNVQTLANGLKVVTQAEQRAVAAVRLTVHAGIADEPVGKGDLAHLVEHLACGSDTGVGRDWFQALFTLGAVQANAMTELDQTSYFAVVPTENVGVMLDVYRRLLTEPMAGVDETLFERERRIVKSEQWLRDDWQVPSSVLTQLRRMLFAPAHPYGHEGFLSPSDEPTLTFEDAKRFAAQHYHPSNATLTVVGGLDNNARAALAGFGSVPLSAQAVPAGVARSGIQWDPAVPVGPKLVKLPLLQQEPRLWFAWKLPPDPEHLDHDAQVIATVADEYLRHPTFAEERHPHVKGAALAFAPAQHGNLLLGMVELTTDAEPDKVLQWITMQVRRAIFNKFGLLKNNMRYDVDPIEASVGLGHAAWLISLEHPLNRGYLLTTAAHDARDPLRVFATLNELGERDPVDVRAFANPWLTSERIRAVHVVDAGQTTELVTQLSPTGDVVEAGHAERAILSSMPTSNLGQHRVAPPRTRKVSSGQLENGLSYVFYDWPGARAPTVMLGYNRGSADAERPDVGLAAQLSMVRPTWLDAGPQGIAFRRFWSEDSSLVAAQSPTVDVVSLAGFLLRKERDERPNWPSYEVDSREAPHMRQAPYAYAWERLLGTHPWGQTPDYGLLQQVTPEEVLTEFARAFDVSHALLVGVGDFSHADSKTTILDSAKTLVGHAQPPAIEVRQWTASPAQAVYFEQLHENSQKAQFACVLPSQVKPAVAQLVERTVRRVLFSNLRQHRAISYSVSSELNVFRGDATVLWAFLDMPTHRVAEGFEVWRAFRSMPAPDLLAAELPAAKLELMASVTELGLTTERVAFALFRSWLTNQPYASIEDLPRALSQTADAEVFSAFDYCREHSVLTFYGNSERLKAGWDL